MSLTNDMLKNLEKARPFKNDDNVLLDDLEAAASNKSYYLTYGIYILVVLLLLSLIVGIFDTVLHRLKLSVLPSETITIKAPHPVTYHKNTVPVHVSIQATPAPVITRPTAVITQPAAVIPTPVVKPAPIISLALLPPPASQAADNSVKTTIQESNQDKMMQDYQDALALIAQNQIPDAIQKLQTLLQEAPNDTNARLALITVYLQNNDVIDAMKIISDGLVLQPRNVPLTLLCARAFMAENQARNALQALNTIADVAANDPSYMDLLASVQQTLGNYSAALSLYQTLLNQDPSNARWLIGLAVSLEKTNQKNDALVAFEKADAVGQLPPDLQAYVTAQIHELGGQ